MAQRRTLYYDGETAVWRDPSGGLIRASLAAAGPSFSESETIVIVPGEDILLTRVALPPIRQAARRLTAARYALEDRLAGRIEQLHFAQAQQTPHAETGMAVVDRDTMAAWCERFEQAGLDVVRIVPDVLALPAPAAGEWQVARIDDRLLARTGPVDGFVCPPDLWPTLANAFEAPARIQLHATTHDAIHALEGFETAEPAPELVPHTHAGADALLGLLLDSPELDRHALNLRQGEFARRSQQQRRWRPLALTAALAVAWLVLAIAGRVIETWQLNDRGDALHAQTLAAFHDAFPDVQNVNDIRVQAEQGIRRLRGGGAGGGLFDLLQATAAVAGATDALAVQSMQYRQGSLDLSIRGENVQSVETLRAGFAHQPGVALDVHSADASASGVRIRATLSRGGS